MEEEVVEIGVHAKGTEDEKDNNMRPTENGNNNNADLKEKIETVSDNKTEVVIESVPNEKKAPIESSTQF